MAELCVSVGVVGTTVLLCEAGRSAVRLFPPRSQLFVLEAVCTFQLCCCTHELKLLGESLDLDLMVALVVTFCVTLLHVLSFRQSSCNPCSMLERLYHGTSGLRTAAGIISCQFGAAVAARSASASIWSLGLSPVHIRHQRYGFRCFDPIGGTLLEAAAMEMSCAFMVQAAAMHAHRLHVKLRAVFLSAVITVLVYTGASVSGAVFNPALAFSVLFHCTGHSFLDYISVYWLPPLSGVASCILLFEKLIPFLSGKSTMALHIQKHKSQ